MNAAAPAAPVAARAPGPPAGAGLVCCARLSAPTLTDDQAKQTAALFKVLADPHRVRILNRLATSPEPVCACDFEAPLGLAQPTVSHHLKKLVQAGLLDREQRGVWAYYTINADAMRRLAAVVDLQGARP
jgi:ArsR family transcriptional regulator